MKGCIMAEALIVPSLYGQKIGVIMQDENGISFQYHKDFDADMLPVSPLSMPFDPKRVFNYYDAMSTNGLPGIFADSLPDSFGTFVMREYFKKERGIVSDHFRLSTVEMLSYIGDDGIGAIEYAPARKREHDIALKIKAYASEIDKLYSGRTDDVLKEILAHASPGGARPKASVLWNQKEDSLCLCHTSNMKEGMEAYIIKFDERGKELTRIEYAYNQIAKDAGIDIPEVSLIRSDDNVHFATKRFDRDAKTGKKFHQVTLAGLTHEDFMNRTFPYEKYIRISQILTKIQKAAEEAYRRMVFNVIGQNCDDHIKNFSFLMDDSGKWTLSPAYDIIHSYGHATFGQHRMTVNGKVEDISLDDLLVCGLNSGMEPNFMKETIEKISDLFAGAGGCLLENGVSSETAKEIMQSIRPISVSHFGDALKRARRHKPKRGVRKQPDTKSLLGIKSLLDEDSDPTINNPKIL